MGWFPLGTFNSMVIQPDNKIVCVGFEFVGNTTDFALGRFTSEGLRDSTFGTNGFLTTSMGPADDNAWGIALQSDMKIVVVGTSYNNYTNKDDFAVIRYQSNGSIDSSFGINGKVILSFGPYCYDEFQSVLIQPDGKLVLNGASCAGSDSSGSAIVRLNIDGSMDTTFGNGGIVVSTHMIFPWAAAIQNDGKIVQGGGNTGFTLMRYNPDGTLDRTFGNNGLVLTIFDSLYNSGIFSLSIQTNGKIVAGGCAAVRYLNYDNYFAFALACYNPDGSLDTTFGNKGKVMTTFSNESENTDCALSGLIQPDHKILLAGLHWMEIYYPHYIALARYLSDLNVGINTAPSIPCSISLYPNPASNKITIETSFVEQNNSLTIVNIEGQQLITRQITESKTQIDISNLPSGIYFVKLANDKVVEVGKFVKE
jgi:uncharacterized delta-60 repeat protein